MNAVRSRHLNSTYRTDIDVLRAFAVVSVVLYHISSSLLAGGFVGVDVFFIISGYLITGQLVTRMQGLRFSFKDFYTRRFRRLYPALMLVLGTSALMGAFIMIPAMQNQLGRELRAVATLSVNYYFLGNENDYFGIAADNQPLLHMWSLSVEEQFYLLWPALLWLTHRLTHVREQHFVLLTLWMMGLLLFSSWLWCVYISFHNNAQAFYGMPSRAWEFAAGGLLAMGEGYRSTGARRIGGSLIQIAGIGVLLLSVICTNSRFVFPGYVVLGPVLGALMFIAGGSIGLHPRWQRWLCTKAVVHTGKISYSFYLWHWVLLAFTRYWYLGRDLERDIWMGGILAYALAHLSYIYVELPMRQCSTPWPTLNRLGFRHGLYAIFLMYLVGNIEIFFPVTLTSAQKRVAQLEADPVHLPEKCTMPKSGVPLGSVDNCSLGVAGQPVRILVWGDSHAGRLLPILSQYAKDHPLRILIRIYNGCPPVMNVVPAGHHEYRSYCMKFANAVTAQMDELSALGVHGVILPSRWLWYLASSEPNAMGLLGPGESAMPLTTGQGLLNTTHAMHLFRQGLDQELRLFRAHGIKVALVLPEPELALSAPECLTRFNDSSCNLPLWKIQQQHQALVTMLKKEATLNPNLRLIDTTSFFCDHRWCYAQKGGIVNFMDDNHITGARAMSMYPFYASVLDWLSQPL
ncbi:MAG: acyltransferase [Pseudomonadales bacterium]|nr:acyltransferase [Pseudomonadales bacterium]